MLAPPLRLQELLSRDSALDAAVHGTLATVVPLIKGNSPPFFPEYTDHGIDHLRKTLQTADALIREESRPYLSAADAAVLSIAVALHDLGMHLTEDGFLSLIANSDRLVPELDAKSWPQLWEDFIAEARRFNGRTLKGLFGDTEPIRRPPSNPDKLERRDRKLIGEFLRRHHARMAHEIAMVGFPGIGKRLAIVNPPFPAQLCDLTGLVARSHGRSVRSCLDYLDGHFDLNEYRGVHAVYLMALLRVADYLQIEAERAPAERLLVSDIKSPTSLGEWRAHQAIDNLTFEGADPEALKIKAKPADVRTFLRLQDLLKGLQEELDLSWAVLGEVYGRNNNLSHLGLKLRRVRSNLDDLEMFSKSVNFVPSHAKFDTADAELLSLLVEPLYGADVNLGVRELIQNAVDACRELADVCEHAHRERPERVGDSADVEVRLLGNTLTVRDNGIGMTADTIQRYFLRAGASYRSSDAWRKLHEIEPGKSRVLRSGRFGIGVLAAFLLGDEIEVTTRHLSCQEAIHFRTTLENDIIELERRAGPVGTCVTVKLRPKCATALANLATPFSEFGSLPGKLYLLSSPSLDVFLPRKCDLGARWPEPGVCLPPGWHRIKPADFGEVHWAYLRGHQNSGLACNGIAISRWSSYESGNSLNSIAIIREASISVFDPDGHLPLDLTRTDLTTGNLPFEADLVADIYRDIVAYCLADPQPARWQERVKRFGFERMPACAHPAVRQGYNESGLPYVFTADGFALQDEWILRQLAITSLVMFGPSDMMCPSIKTGNAITADPQMGFKETDCDRFVEERLRLSVMHLQLEASRIHIPLEIAARWPKDGMPGSHRRLARLDAAEAGKHVYSMGKPFVLWDETQLPCPGSSLWAIAECQLARSQPPIRESPLGQAFMKHLGTCLIPYDMAERRRRFPEPFAVLAEMIAAHETLSLWNEI